MEVLVQRPCRDFPAASHSIDGDASSGVVQFSLFRV
jgi:hypothetical protein